ncbi:growth arrest and DNA damage-inducible proteins-interacting protein 1 isoform X1 [Formica exsecta]|uniref:growth arrest and DNA damage-inducible proteins-interacting protein 1 isoform X1 n=2 Tax=Formica exsecta TaxID=72781 RepID=UPI001143777F|nr:growth arrest and DNA damage-inducible proteins-interacting protein 1 isoform X1 [Formica exsecta]
MRFLQKHLLLHRIDVAMSLRQIYDIVVRRNVRVQSVLGRFFATESTESKNEAVDITAADEKPIYSPMDDSQFQEELARKRNKSRLSPQDRNVLMGLRPYDKPMSWHHYKVKYKRVMLGRYGLAANGIPAGFAWPTRKEIRNAEEYERVAFPLSLQERWKELEERKQRKADQIKARENQLLEKAMKMGEWRAQLNAKIVKKEAELEAARLRKERLVEEIRRHFGFKISPHDERFKEMLVQKEKEEKKKKKEAKKQARLERITNMIQRVSKDESQKQVTDSTKSVE